MVMVTNQPTTAEERRLAALYSLAILDTAFESEFDALARVAAELAECPIAMIGLVDRHRHWFKAVHGLDIRECPRRRRFCDYAIEGRTPLMVPDALEDPRFCQDPLVVGEPQVRFYLGAPIMFSGECIGTIGVMDTKPRVLSQDRQRAFADLAMVVSSILVNRRLNQRLRDSDRLLSKLSEHVPGLIYVYQEDPQGVASFPYTSDAAHLIFEVEPETLVLSADRAWNRLHRDDFVRVWESVSRSARDLSIWRDEFRVVLPVRGMRWIEGHATPERRRDGTVLWHGYMLDITERKATEFAIQQSDQRAKMAMAAARIGVGDWQPADQLIRLDDLSIELYGLDVTRRHVSLPDLLATIVPADRERVEMPLRNALQTAQPCELGFCVRRPGQDDRHVEFRAQPVLESTDRDRHTILISRDVTAQHEAERLRRAKQAAEQADHAKGELLARVSHELRTPLNAILGFTQLLRQDEGMTQQARRSDQLQHIETAGQHLLALINDILELSQEDSGVLPFNLQPVEIRLTLERCVAMIEPAASSAGIRIECSGFDTPYAALADQRRLEQCVVNLLSNAIKYNRPRGLVRVAVTIQGGRALIRVADTGRGLSAEQVNRLFRPFERLGVQDSGIEGTGLGLSITKNLVERMGGTLTVVSEPGVGSEFVLQLPVAGALERRPIPSGAVTQVLASRAPSSEGSDDQYAALYVEDNGLNRMLMSAIFDKLPRWQLFLADNSDDCLLVLEELTPDLLLLDIHLPGGTGIELLQRIRGIPRLAGIPAIAVSADAMAEDITRAKQAGFADYWVKPIDTVKAISAFDQLFAAAKTLPTAG